MASPERRAPKQEYGIANFYLELAKLQKEEAKTADTHLSYINLEDLDEKDMNLYLVFKGLRDFDSSNGDIRGRRIDDKPKSNPPKIEDVIEARKKELETNGNLSQKLFYDYIKNEYDKIWGLDKPYKPEEPKKPEGNNGPTEL